MSRMQRYRAAIVDDSQEYREEVREVLQSVADRCEKAMECLDFSRAEKLENELQAGAYFDIYVLDIEMPGMNGMELARGIRDKYPEVCIIFVTSYSRFALESYEIDAYQYILKDKLAQRLPQAMEKYFRRTAEETEEACYTISTNNRLERFRFKDIIWIYKSEKYAVFVTKEKTYRQRATLSDVCKMLPEGDFVFIERGIVVNIPYIDKVNGNEMTLVNGKVLNASRSYLKKVREEITRYWSRQI